MLLLWKLQTLIFFFFFSSFESNVLSRGEKCDETRPDCQNCIKHGIECFFAEIPNTDGQVRTASPLSASAIPSPSSGTFIGESTGPSMGLAEMKLLHHFSTSTCYTISRLPVLQTVWRIRVPKIGFSYPYVLHGILSLSALHLAQLQPECHDDYVAQAELHHNRALEMISSHMRNINNDNAPAVYLFSTVTSIISCAKPRQPDDFWVFGGKDIEWLSLFRGTRFIISAAETTIKTGSLSPMFEIGKRRNHMRNARSATELTYVEELRYLLKTRVTDERILSCYLDAVDDLAKTFALIEEEGHFSCQTADVFVWLLQISDDYLLLLRQRTPEALLIFSYFCVITRELEWAWWMQGLSIHLIRGIYYCLSEEYRCWLQWPMEQLGWSP
jgi:hypothetical protein